MYRVDKLDQELWHVATDIAVESAILDMEISGIDNMLDKARQEEINRWKTKLGTLTAERIYKELRANPLDFDDMNRLAFLFNRDEGFLAERQNQLNVYFNKIISEDKCLKERKSLLQ